MASTACLSSIISSAGYEGAAENCGTNGETSGANDQPMLPKRVDDYVTKPFSPVELDARIRRAFIKHIVTNASSLMRINE